MTHVDLPKQNNACVLVLRNENNVCMKGWGHGQRKCESYHVKVTVLWKGSFREVPSGSQNVDFIQ